MPLCSLPERGGPQRQLHMGLSVRNTPPPHRGGLGRPIAFKYAKTGVSDSGGGWVKRVQVSSGQVSMVGKDYGRQLQPASSGSFELVN